MADNCEVNMLNYSFQYIQNEKTNAIIRFCKDLLKENAEEIHNEIDVIMSRTGDLSEEDSQEIRFMKRLKGYLEKKLAPALMSAYNNLPDKLESEIHDYFCEFKTKEDPASYFKEPPAVEGIQHAFDELKYEGK